MEAGKKSITDIFNGRKIVEIPFFQRSYVWGESEWERFLEDMEHISQNSKSYFFGSVILKQKPDPNDIRILIDGQQRLTTLIIFFKTLWLLEEQDDLFKQTFTLLGETHKLALQHNHNDISAFEKIAKLNKIEEIDDKSNLFDAYNFFKDNIKVEKLDWKNIIHNIMFVGMDILDQEDNEQQIFDTINSLGVRLTTAELLKNHLFNRDELDSYEKNWRDIFEADDEVKQYWDREIAAGRSWRTIIDLFFYAYLQIKIQDPKLKVKPTEKIEFSRFDNLFNSYKKLIKDYKLNTKDMVAEIKEYATLFKDNFDHETLTRELPGEFGIERINAIIFGLENSTLIPYTLFILNNVKDEKERNKLFGIIETFIMRRMVVRATSKNYNLLFTGRMIPNKILSAKKFLAEVTKSEYHVNFLPNNEDLSQGFHESRLVNKQSRGILYFIESKLRDPKYAHSLLGFAHYSLEHLMPKKWRNHWGTLGSEQDADERNRKLLTLGNLALITKSLNASVRDSAWEIKKHGNKKNKGLEHYASGLETLSPYLKKSDWDESHIKKRAKDLSNHAVKIWPIDI